jgi:DMSO reductase family type II enzyme molybdopterin subunit
VVRGTHGINCAGTCAFNVYVKNGIVWREEQQAEYGASGDSPDYGPRGCQKGLRHSKYMYGPQRILYPMKRVGERGAGKWERVTWEQATTEIADCFIDVATQHGPQAISLGTGTQLSLKRASMAGLSRFGALNGLTMPEMYSGVGDLPSGLWATTGENMNGDTMGAIFQSKCCLVWMSNPAATRIPDAHFFWEARYNGTRVIAISPDFTPTAMHASYWVNPKPGTDAALAMAMAHVILQEKLYKPAYIKEQTDLPLLVRTDNGRFLRASDVQGNGPGDNSDNNFYVWDSVTNQPVRAPGAGSDEGLAGTLDLGDLDPALEGRWQVPTPTGTVQVTTVFELTRVRAAEHAPEKVAKLTGVSPKVMTRVARMFAKADPAMIYMGYAACKWVHGDLLQRAMLLLLALTGNTGKEGGGLQVANAATSGMGWLFKDTENLGSRVISTSNWDYENGNMKQLNAQLFGRELAENWDRYYQESLERRWAPSFSEKGWKMGIFAGQNPANWRAAGKRWREEIFDKLECIVAMAPDMGITPFYADYVLPISQHYERIDVVMQSRLPYMHVQDAAVPPLGESVDDWEAFRRLAAAISQRARERDIEAFEDDLGDRKITRDLKRLEELYTLDGELKDIKDVLERIMADTFGIPKTSFDEMAAKGILRVNGSEGTTWKGYDSPFKSAINNSVAEKKPYKTLTGRQQYYIDHEWFLELDEALPGYQEPLSIKGYPLRMMMGHARHRVHSMWGDDSFLLSLQRGEPDIYVNPDDAADRDVADGDLIRIFNPMGEFYAIAHLSAGVQPGMLFMYHGWDPMQFRTRMNFGGVVATGGVIKPVSMAGGYGHIHYRGGSWSPNQTYKDFTCNFDKAPADLGLT